VLFLVLVIAGCGKADEPTPSPQFGSHGELQAVVESVLTYIPQQNRPRIWLKNLHISGYKRAIHKAIVLDQVEVEKLLAILHLDKWELNGLVAEDKGYINYPEGFTSRIEIEAAGLASDFCISVCYETGTAVVSKMLGGVTSTGKTSFGNYKVPTQTIKCLLNFERDIITAYAPSLLDGNEESSKAPIHELAGFDDLQAIGEDILRFAPEMRLPRVFIRRQGGSYPLSQEEIGKLLTILSLASWEPAGDVQDCFSYPENLEFPDFALNPDREINFDEEGLIVPIPEQSDFSIEFYYGEKAAVIRLDNDSEDPKTQYARMLICSVPDSVIVALREFEAELIETRNNP